MRQDNYEEFAIGVIGTLLCLMAVVLTKNL